MKKNNIYMDKEGYQQYLNSIELLKVELSKIRYEMSKSIVEAPGDGSHDNFAFEDGKRQEEQIIRRIEDKRNELGNIIIIEKQNNKKIIDIGTSFS